MIGSRAPRPSPRSRGSVPQGQVEFELSIANARAVGYDWAGDVGVLTSGRDELWRQLVSSSETRERYGMRMGDEVRNGGESVKIIGFLYSRKKDRWSTGFDTRKASSMRSTNLIAGRRQDHASIDKP